MDVRIRPLKEEDAYTSVKWRNDKDVFKYTGNTYDHEITLESELEWIKRVIAKKDDCRCAILADDLYVGNIYLTDITKRTATYHIFIGNREYWGKGVARKASELILNYAFTVLSLDSVQLKVHKENKTALSLYHKLGFREKFSDSKFVSMELSAPNIKSLCTTVYDVTIKSIIGDGLYFDFTFGIDNSEEQLSYTLYPLNDSRYPQKKLVYTNLNPIDGMCGNISEVVKFIVPMPKGYNAAYQISRDNKWIGLKGELAIGKSEKH